VLALALNQIRLDYIEAIHPHFVDVGSEVMDVNTRASSRFESPSKDRFYVLLIYVVYSALNRVC